MSAAAMANWAAGNSGVGPGVNKRVLRIMALSSFSTGPDGEAEAEPESDRFVATQLSSSLPTANRQSQNTQNCDNCDYIICGILAVAPNFPRLPQNRYNFYLGRQKRVGNHKPMISLNQLIAKS